MTDTHHARMARKKAVVDAAIARADQDRGLLLVLTGNGKGKSSSAFGMLARTLGHGYKAGVAQFIKSRRDTGEEAHFSVHPAVEWHVLGEGFTWDTQNREQDATVARAGWEVARTMLRNPELHLVILDELTYLINDGHLALEDVLDTLNNRPAMQHVVITGRTAPQALVDSADTVTEMRDVKHAFRAGLRAQPGVDL